MLTEHFAKVTHALKKKEEKRWLLKDYHQDCKKSQEK